MATTTGWAHNRIGLMSQAVAITIALLLGPCLCLPVAAQTTQQDGAAKPAAKPGKKPDKASKAAMPPAPTTAAKGPPKTGDAPTAEKTPPQPPKKLDPAKIDLLKLTAAAAMQADPKKFDAKSANSWVVLGQVEAFGGNLAGALESLERAIALGERRNKPAAHAGAILLGKVHNVYLSFVRTEAQGVASFGGTPSKDTTDTMTRHLNAAKAAFEKAVVLGQAAGNKAAMAAGYAQMGESYRTTTDYEEAQAEFGKALAINKALQNKKAMAANYRALAEVHRYDLDQAESLLKEAIVLHEALGLKEELARDYEKLGAVNKSRGEPYEAEKLYKQALALTPRPEQGQLLRALEQLYRDRGDPGLAAEMKELGQAIYKERLQAGSGGRIIFDSDMGLWVSSAIGKAQTEALEKAIPMEKKIGHWTGLATSYLLLAMHYDERAEHDEGRRAELLGRAEATIREAIALNRTLGREEAMGYAYRELAEIVDKRGNLAEVEETLKETHALYKKLGKEKELGRLYSSLGYGRSRRGDKAQACDYWRKGATAYPDEKRLADAVKSDCAPTQLAAPTAKPAAETANPIGQTEAAKPPPPAATATGAEAPPKQATTAAKPTGQAAVAEKGQPPAAKDAATATGAEAPPKQATTAAKPTGQAAVAEKGPPPAVKNAAATAKGAEVPPMQAGKVDIGSMDPMQIRGSAMQVHVSKDDRDLPNSWIALGFVEARGGNLAGAEASLEQAMTLGEQQHNKAAVAAAALLLGLTHSVGLNFMRVEADTSARLKKLGEKLRNKPADDRPDDNDDLASYISRQYARIKALYEKAIALTKALDHKDGMADAYAQSGEFYTSSGEYEQAQAAIGEALALNKALQRKKQLAANYRALAATHGRDPDQSATLLKQAIALNEALGLTKELAEDYERLGAISKSRGEPHEAVRLYKQALALTPRKEDQGSLLRTLGRVYRDLNDPGLVGQMEAEASAADEARLADGGGRILYVSTSLGMWMSSAAAKTQVESLEKAVPMEKALDNQIGLATTYGLLGMHYAQRAEIDTDRRTELQAQAEAMLNDALALNTRLKREKAVAHAYGQLVELYSKRGNPDQASKSLVHVVELYRKQGDKGSIARLYIALGHGSKNQGDTDQACAYWRQGSVEVPDDKMLADTFNRECFATR